MKQIIYSLVLLFLLPYLVLAQEDVSQPNSGQSLNQALIQIEDLQQQVAFCREEISVINQSLEYHMNLSEYYQFLYESKEINITNREFIQLNQQINILNQNITNLGDEISNIGKVVNWSLSFSLFSASLLTILSIDMVIRWFRKKNED